MTTTKKIADFRVTWTADHEQYYPGHGIAATEYTHDGRGVDDTLREAFNSAVEDLTQQGIDVDYDVMLAELTSQVKSPEMLDLDINTAYCIDKGKHGPRAAIAVEDCAVCAGEWHFYVNIDVKVE